jgi:signal transduction histidine kinase
MSAGECEELVHATDWARTPIGPMASWPQSLKTIVSVMLHSRHPMFLWWGPELIQIYNDAYVPSFGIGKHPTAMGQRGVDCWQEIWPIIWPQIDDVMSRGKSSWNEDQLVPIFRNGRLEDVFWTYGYSPVFLESGVVGGTLVVCTETTARVVSERRLRTLRELAERTSSAVDSAGIIEAAAEVLANARDDVSFARFYGPAQGGAAPSLVHAVGLQQGDADVHGFAADLKEPQTGRVWGSVVFGSSPRLPFDAAYREFFLHVSEHLVAAGSRIDAFNSRAAAEAERRNLLLQAPVATALLTGPNHLFELANPRYREMVGRDVVGKTYLEAFPELTDSPIPGILDRVYRQGEPFFTNETLVQIDRRGTGLVEDCYFKFNLEPLRDTAGTVYGMMAVAVDLTELVNARRVLEKAHLEREGLLVELESASRAKDEFLAMLGHELRNPLSPIVSALQLMRRRGDGTPSREEQVIERQVTHLVRLVDDLLDVSKITRGKVELEKETVEIADVLAKALEMASLLFEQRRHRLSVVAPRTGLAWYGDPVRLAQVVANLLTNAARYTDPGGTIVLTAAREDGDIVISVTDNGIGIAPDTLPHVFDMFVQAKRSTHRAEGGLGLGLTLVKTLVALHGGTVLARSEGLGRGSQFVIRLPATVEANVDRQPTSDPVLAPLQARRVLVVDDNVDAAELLGETLRSQGHDVNIANDPILALATLEHFDAEVAILDIGLPVMDGYELAAKMRATWPSCRLIALTGYGQEHDRARSEKAGFERHFVKPVNLGALLETIGH